jgi:hypothetical protein
MSERSDAPAAESLPREKIMPFVEGAVVETTLLVSKLFTTPFAVLFYTKGFREQLPSLASEYSKPVFSITVARPLSFYLAWVSAHLYLAFWYWRALAGERVTNALLEGVGVRQNTWLDTLANSYERLSKVIGQIPTLVCIGVALVSIIAVNAGLVTAAGRLLRCPIRFQTVLQATAYAFGTLIFFQYILIIARIAAGQWFGQPALAIGRDTLVYASAVICIVLAVRINQIIRDVDRTTEARTYASWILGMICWQFIIAGVSSFIYGGQFGFIGLWIAFIRNLRPLSLQGW